MPPPSHDIPLWKHADSAISNVTISKARYMQTSKDRTLPTGMHTNSPSTSGTRSYFGLSGGVGRVRSRTARRAAAMCWADAAARTGFQGVCCTPVASYESPYDASRSDTSTNTAVTPRDTPACDESETPGILPTDREAKVSGRRPSGVTNGKRWRWKGGVE